MSRVFYGWRRKCGCALLVISCALMGLWLRSYLVHDDVLTVAAGRQLYSHNGCLSWNITTADDSWTDWIQPSPAAPPLDHSALPRFTWRREYFGFVASEIAISGSRIVQYWVPYWFLATPLAVISAILLLWPTKRRPDERGAATLKFSQAPAF